MADKSPRAGAIALVGRTNVGKSTLVNRLVGGRVAITADRPQTTRRIVRGIRTYPDENAQLVLVDAPGLHKPQDALSDVLVERARSALHGADGVLCLVEAGDRLAGATKHVIQALPKPGEGSVPVVLVVTKTDRHPHELVLLTLDEVGSAYPFRAKIATSAETGEGYVELEKILLGLLPVREHLYPDDQVTDLPREERAAEIVREKLLLTLRDEVPHAAHVQVDEIADRPDGTLFIACTIYVERESQKGIVIGKGGAQIKRVGALAREELEFLTKRKVFLKTEVKVKSGWRRDPRVLREFGLG
ncbi:MAG TPA: GTPase Era [Planctomycetota bacterium]|nr:GTPase Era [Planctomycetota bacterium]